MCCWAIAPRWKHWCRLNTGFHVDAFQSGPQAAVGSPARHDYRTRIQNAHALKPVREAFDVIFIDCPRRSYLTLMRWSPRIP